MICTTADCEAESTLYLCGHCIRDFDAWIDQAEFLLPELDVTIARLDNVRVGNIEGGNGTKSAGSSAPLDIDAVQLKINLSTIDRRATDYAKDPHAAPMAALLAEWITKAELIISGPEDNAPTPYELNAMRNELAQQFPDPMPPRQCATWLRENAGIKIAARNINDWYHRGRIRKQEGSTPKRPLYSPKEVLIAHMTRQHE